MARPVRRGTSAVLAAVVGGLVLAGCAGGEPESPFPPRPVDIDISTLDPCSTLSPPQLEALGLGTGTPGTATVNGTVARDCTWLGHGDASNYGVQFINLDAASAIRERGAQLVTVAGYGAVRSATDTNNGPGIPAFCQLAIDVSDEQTIRIQVNNGRPRSGGDPEAIRAVCRQAEHAAAEVLATVAS